MTLSLSGYNKVLLSVGNGAKEAAESAASAATSASNASASASAAATSASDALGYTTTAGGRPGDLASAYGQQVSGSASSIPSLSSSSVVLDTALGAALRVTSATYIAPRAPQPIEPGRVYAVRYAVSRAVDPTDPLGDAVRTGLQWLSYTWSSIGSVTCETIPLTIAMGVQYRVVTCAVDVPGVEVVIPASVRYVRPWIRTYGDDHGTRVGRVDIVDITDAWNAQVSADASVQTEDLQSAIDALVGAAPRTIETLSELAAALGADENFATTVTATLATKAPLELPAFTGVATAETAAPGTATQQLATTEFVDAVRQALTTSVSNLATDLSDEVTRAETAIEAEVARAKDEETALWDQQSATDARTAPIVTLPTVPIGLREIEPTRVSYDLCVTEGRWSDTGLPWAVDGRFDGTALLPETITDEFGAQIVVTLWSYDLCPLTGYYASSGDTWPVDVVTVYPEMVVETSADEVVIYYKSGSADRPTYIQHRMEHYVDAARNTDVWRTNQPSEARRLADGSFEVVQRIIQDSEVDTAVKLMGNVDLSGGKFHGNEEMTREPVWMIDGVQIDPADGLTYAPHRVELLQQTQLYDPGTTVENQFSPVGPAIMELTKRHRWQNGEYGIRTHVKELVTDPSKTIEFAYFLMCPIMRLDTADNPPTIQITHTVAREPYYELEDVSAGGFTKIATTADRLLIWGDRYAAEWYAIDGWDDPSRIIYVDNRTSYNKIYASFFRNGAHALSGAEYDVESAFKITIKEGI